MKGPNYVHPEKGSAVGSRNSLYRDGRNEYAEARLIIDEEVDKIMNHITTKLPPEVLEKLHVGGTIKEVLHDYYNQGFQNMYNRYLVTAEDEMAKKLRDMIDKQESKTLNQYTPTSISYLLNSIKGEEAFQNGAIEKSISSIYSNLQSHLQKSVVAVERKAQKLLSEKNDIGFLLDGNQASSVLKCTIHNNELKPETVTDVNLIINIVDSELIEPIYEYQVASEVIIKNVLSEHVLKIVEKEIQELNTSMVSTKGKGLNMNSWLFEKIKKLEEHIGFGEQSEDSSHFSHLAKKFVDAIKGIDAEIDLVDFDPLNVRENVKKIIDDENIRNKGFNKAVSSLTGILDEAQLGYQHIENFKNCRKVVIREYAGINPSEVPDENYTVTLCYQDDLQLRELRTAYCQQMDEFQAEMNKLLKVFGKIHQMEKKKQGFMDYEDVTDQILKNQQTDKAKKEVEVAVNGKTWDEISFIQPEKSDIEKLNETFAAQSTILKRKFKIVREKILDLYQNENPAERVLLDQRLDFLEEQFRKFKRRYNPFQAQTGLLLEFTLSSVKRREITLTAMSNTINRFISGIATGFTDSAFEEYHQRKRIEESKDKQAFMAAS